jgi:hypothetical protein
MYWLLGRKSNLKTGNNILIYKAILNPIWTYGISLWGTASTSNIEIVERFQPKTLRMIVDVLRRAVYGYPKGSPRRNPPLQLSM